MNTATKVRTVHEAYATPGGRVIDAGRPWFRVRGERTLYRFTQLVVFGRRVWIEAIDREGRHRTLNVGKAYTRAGLRVPQYRVLAARAPKGV